MNDREILLQLIYGLTLAENLGDVHDEINVATDRLGLPRLDGDFFDGFDRGPIKALLPTRTYPNDDSEAGR